MARTPRQEMRHWYEKAWPASEVTGKHGPHVGDGKCRLKGKGERAAYRTAVVAVKKRSKTWGRKISIDSSGIGIQTDTRCDHCLRAVPIVIVRPSIVSEDPDCDFVCAQCDPRVETWMIAHQVLGLVETESA